MLSAAKHLRTFPGFVMQKWSEILRFTQDDSLLGEAEITA